MFAWSEATKPRVLWQRATGGSHLRSVMEREPLFCMETAIKMLYFSGMAYEHDEVSGAAQLLSSMPAWLLGRVRHDELVERLHGKGPFTWTAVPCARQSSAVSS